MPARPRGDAGAGDADRPRGPREDVVAVAPGGPGLAGRGHGLAGRVDRVDVRRKGGSIGIIIAIISECYRPDALERPEAGAARDRLFCFRNRLVTEPPPGRIVPKED